MKATSSTQTLDDFQWTIWHYILEDKTIIKHSLIYHDGKEVVYEAIKFIKLLGNLMTLSIIEAT
jgi:hypothetical protein